MKLVQPLLWVFVALLITACGDNKKMVDVGNEKQILYIGNGDEIADVDPHLITGMPEYHVLTALYEGLVSKDPKTMASIPGVAESWEVSEDGLNYVFKIRANAKWSNGDDLVAQDFVDSWHRALMPALGNQYAASLFVVKNAEAFFNGEMDFDQVGVKALDSKHLQVQLAAPTPYFLQLLDHHSTYPVHIRTIEKFGALDERGSPWTRPENFVSNGPFKLKEWTPNKYLSVEKSDTYWDKDHVYLNEVRFYPIPKSTVEERMFRAGQLHITYYLPRDKLGYYQTQFPQALRSFPNYATYFYRFNTTIAPLKDLRVRKALAYSVDRKAIVEQVTKFGQQPAYALTPPDDYGYKPRATMPYDPALARKLLADAGFPDGKGFPKLKLMFNTNEEHKNVALAIQRMWKKELGIDISLENAEWKVFLDRERQMDYQIDRASWVGDYLDPNTFLELFTTGNGNNKTGFSNPEYDALLRAAAEEPDQPKRMELFQRADEILVEQIPILPLYTYQWNRLVSPYVHGWFVNPMEYFSYKNVWLSSDTSPDAPIPAVQH